MIGVFDRCPNRLIPPINSKRLGNFQRSESSPLRKFIRSDGEFSDKSRLFIYYNERDLEHLGGHAALAVGFDQAQKRFIVRNSWGKERGMNGYCAMPFRHLETLAGDFWTIRK